MVCCRRGVLKVESILLQSLHCWYFLETACGVLLRPLESLCRNCLRCCHCSCVTQRVHFVLVIWPYKGHWLLYYCIECKKNYDSEKMCDREYKNSLFHVHWEWSCDYINANHLTMSNGIGMLCIYHAWKKCAWSLLNFRGIFLCSFRVHI